MAEAPALTICRDWTRPDPSVIRQLAGTPTGFVVDALGRFGAFDHGIRPLIHAKPFIGAALPVATTARDNLAPYAALKVAKPGDVMIIATNNYAGASVVGDLIIGMMRNCGIVAVITDGLVRDQQGMRDVGIPVFARGISPNSPFKHGPGSVGLPITIGGLVVSAGDVVVGDEDGVAIIPGNRIDEVFTALDGVRSKEAKMDAAVKGGLKLPDWLDATCQEKGVRWLDRAP